MKIATISTYVSNGGAAIAAFRLHKSLMKHSDISPAIIQKFAESRDFMTENRVYLAEKDKSFISKVQRRLGLDTETLQSKSLENRPNSYEMVSFATSSYRLDKHPIIKEADIIHLHWVAEFLDYPTFFKNVKQPIVWTLHDMNPFQGIFHYKQDEINNQEKLGDLDKKNLELKLKAIHKKENIHIVALSDWMKNLSQLSPTFGLYPHYLIPNGLDFNNFPLLDKTTIKKKIGLDNNRKTLLFIAADIKNPRKGFNLLLSAIERLDNINFNFISIGGKKISVDDKINHIHYEKITNIADLNKIYTAADLTILPSREDNLPNIMLESFANGTPVISFSNGGMKEHIKNGKNGILIENVSYEGLLQGISEFLNDQYSFDNNKIREYAIDTFSDTKQTKKYLDLYNTILNLK